MSARLASDYPFGFRGPAQMDEFGKHALARLHLDSESSFHRFEEIAGPFELAYAVSRTMSKKCVA